MRDWHVTLTLNGTITDDDADTLIAALAPQGAAIALSDNDTTFSLTARADTIPTALTTAIAHIKAAACHLDSIAMAATTAATIETYEHLTSDLARPVFPEVVGYAEVAQMAGVSRQAARQYGATSTFPRPVIETAQGPLMSKAAVQGWLDGRADRRVAV